MPDCFVAVVVPVPDELFDDDDDDICLKAGNFVCARLETHLVQHGHAIPGWVNGGCDEDWGVYFASECAAETFEYHICFFPQSTVDHGCQMMIQYHRRVRLWKRLFTKPRAIGANHHMHETMHRFGETFESSIFLTQSQLDSEY